MKLTKLEHACLVLAKGSATLVIDPGSFTIPLVETTGIVAIVITHEHADHWTPEHLDHILKGSPDATIYGPAGVAAAAAAYDVHVVHDGDVVTAGPVTLAVHGVRHAVIHESLPVVDNVGVLVDDALYYPGDSFTVPPVPVDTLAAPAGAPWLKIAEAMDFVDAVAPRRAFPTHQMVLSKIGQGIANQRLADMTEKHGGEFFPLEPGESLEL
jgi:L-ascorbate metabolism protein UlaG (beta-lactamase superfamily)